MLNYIKKCFSKLFAVKNIRMSQETFQVLTVINTIVQLLAVTLILMVGLMHWNSIKNESAEIIKKELKKSNVIETIKKISDRNKNTDGIVKAYPAYALYIKAKHMRKLKELTDNLAHKESMSDADKIWFPAKFIWNDEIHKVKVRLRGDLKSHWSGDKKSWRIKFNKDHLFQGLREINLVIPADKAYEIEEVAYKLSRKEGLLVPRSGFSELSINDTNYGLYFWFEQAGKELIEITKHSQGDIISDDNAWLDGMELNYPAHNIPEDTFPGYYKQTIKGNNLTTRIAARWKELLSLTVNSPGEAYSENISSYVNIEKFIRWNAIVLLFGSQHAMVATNVRWYYDTSSGLFEPILYDVASQSLGEWEGNNYKGKLNPNIVPSIYNPIVRRLLTISSVVESRNEYLWGLLNDKNSNLANLVEMEYKNIRPYFENSKYANEPEIIHPDWANKQHINRLNDSRKTLISYLNYARVFIDAKIDEASPGIIVFRIIPDSIVMLNVKTLSLNIPGENYQNLDDVIAVLKSPDGTSKEIKLHVINSNDGGVKFELKDINIVPEFINSPNVSSVNLKTTVWELKLKFPHILPIDLFSAKSPLDYDISFRHGLSNETLQEHLIHKATISTGKSNYFSDSLGSNAEYLHNYFTKIKLPLQFEDGIIRLPAGKYILEYPLIIPKKYKLVLMPGVEIRMGKNASIITYRALTAVGTLDHPIIIKPKNAGIDWGVIGVVNAKQERSDVSYLHIEGGSEKWINGVFFSGQLSFYHSDVNISDSVINNSRADDGLNIKDADFQLTRTRFEGNSSDAYDGDWVSGNISNCIFINNGGDGLDFSGSDVNVYNSFLKGMVDKGISVGEKTHMAVINTSIIDSDIGVAVKDLSEIDIINSVFHNNNTGISAYQKKAIFGAASANVYGALLWDNKEDFIVDKLSTINVFTSGVKKWNSKNGITGEEIQIGNIDNYYDIDSSGNITYSGNGSSDSLFSFGHKLPQNLIDKHNLPDLSLRPLGLTDQLNYSE